MADITQTPANVKIITGVHAKGTAGETITQGEPIYAGVNGEILRADNNDTAVKAVVIGIALTPATIGQPVIYALPGSTVNLGATLAVSETYILSSNVGKIAPIGDLGTTHFSTTLGPAISTSVLLFSPVVSGVQKP